MSALEPQAEVFKLASVLLQYPTRALFDGLDTLDAHAASTKPRAAREAFGRFLGWLRASDPTVVAEHYVRTFDLPGKKHNRCAPYLTYFRHGDTRRRGMAMIEFKGAYRGAGFTPCEDELPDYVPMVLDFAAFSPRGVRLLREHRADLELLQRALQEAGSPYADLLVAVGAQLPRLGRRELVQVVKAWESGPPREDVGLEPFAPPEYLSGYGAAPTAGGV